MGFRELNISLAKRQEDVEVRMYYIVTVILVHNTHPSPFQVVTWAVVLSSCGRVTGSRGASMWSRRRRTRKGHSCRCFKSKLTISFGIIVGLSRVVNGKQINSVTYFGKRKAILLSFSLFLEDPLAHPHSTKDTSN